MPKIKLKPNSAEYADDYTQQDTALCDMPGCAHCGTHKAPKHRALNEYYMFCLDHVQEYNRAWNFFSGMNDDEVMDHLHKEYYGHRPTWKYGVNGDPEEVLKGKAWDTYQGYEGAYEKRQQEEKNSQFSASSNSQEFKALALMGLEPPVTLHEIKIRYKELAKKHHPDLNKGSQKSEELLKQINMAYTVLKLAYTQFEELPER